MKRYLADVLVVVRLGLAVVLIVMAFCGGAVEAGFVAFVLGELTDAFDGTCASRWPFPAHRSPWWRKYASKYDMYADMLLGIGMALFFIFRVNFVAGWIICGGYAGLAFVMDLIIYGKLLGHPDDFEKWALMWRNFRLAKFLVLARRRLYVVLIGVIAIWTLYASGWPLVVKVVITVLGAGVVVWLWFFLAQRRKNISRDAVDIEKKLAK